MTTRLNLNHPHYSKDLLTLSSKFMLTETFTIMNYLSLISIKIIFSFDTLLKKILCVGF